MNCKKELISDEIGLHKKLFGRAVVKFMCVDCCSKYLCIDKDILIKKINQFKEMGCTLFKRL